MPKQKVHVGDKFGAVTVIKEIGRNKYGKVSWECICDCGKTTKTVSGELLRGNKKSCEFCRLKDGKLKLKWSGFADISGEYWGHVKVNADKRNIPIEVSSEEVWELFLEQDRKCALTGLDIWFTPRKVRNQPRSTIKGNASLDRIDSQKGYTLDNVQWVHKTINFMKSDLNEEDFINFCKLVTKKAGK